MPTAPKIDPKLLKPLAVGFVAILLIFSTFGTVNAGERGVRLRFGAVLGAVIEPGLYVKIPLIEQVFPMDVKTLKEEIAASAASKDLQIVTSHVALNFHIDPIKVQDIYQSVGPSYNEVLIAPALQESIKAVMAKYTAEELIIRREQVRDEVSTLLVQKISSRGITVDAFNITNFEFSKSFNDAIEAKVTAEQNAQAAKNKLEQVKYEAEQRIAEAEGKAKAIQVEAEALRRNPQVLTLRAIEKWNGELPKVTSEAVPFIGSEVLR